MTRVDRPSKASPISVTLAIGKGWCQHTLPETLLRAGMLRRLFRFGLDLEVFDPDVSGALKLVRRFGIYRAANRVLWGVWNGLPGTGRSKLPIVATTWLADRLAAGHIPPSSIFHSWTAVSLASMRVAKRTQSVTLIENPMLHPQHWQREVLAECKRFNVRPHNCDTLLPAAMIKRREGEFQMCDKIIVPSEVARRSFEELGYGSKTVVVWPGVDHRFFQPQPRKEKGPIFRVCYVGRVELPKGIAYLIEAWRRLHLKHAELVLAGQVRPEVESILRDCSSYNVRLFGHLSAAEVAACYRESDVFVFPSVSEGLALVLLEAMACALAVVATTVSGAMDCVTEGREGLIVPPRNVEALADAILWAYQHRDELIAMSEAARRRVENQFTLEHYVERQMAMYRSVA
jgi:alpha-maltose-1-phosphate synthase